MERIVAHHMMEHFSVMNTAQLAQNVTAKQPDGREVRSCELQEKKPVGQAGRGCPEVGRRKGVEAPPGHGQCSVSSAERCSPGRVKWKVHGAVHLKCVHLFVVGFQ